jgi:hypothetical protein
VTPFAKIAGTFEAAGVGKRYDTRGQYLVAD